MSDRIELLEEMNSELYGEVRKLRKNAFTVETRHREHPLYDKLLHWTDEETAQRLLSDVKDYVLGDDK